MQLTKLTATLAALLVGTAAAAEPVAVEYFAQRKPFAAVTATDVLQFELYEDENCSNLISTSPLFGGDDAASFFVDKLQNVKGGQRRAKAIRIHAVIDAPIMNQAPYLRVTGTGIAPVGDECQLQAGSPVSGSGASGPAGPQGPAGADGATGPEGLAGADGATGPQGPAGVEGATGPQGPAGVEGAMGPQGLAGVDGATGPEGLAGLDGATGPEGPQGPQGLAGLDGPTGPEGPQGLAGLDGATGPEGPQGPQGLAGLDGATGPRGPPVSMAKRGRRVPLAPTVTGPQGPAGPDGATGPQGGVAVEAEASVVSNSGTVSTSLAGGSTDANRICFLTGVDLVDVDRLLEHGTCSVTFDGGTGWSLEATAGVENAEATCKASCLSW